MIRLTLTTGEYVYVAPEQIVSTRGNAATVPRTQVYTTFATDKTDYLTVKETPLDIVRLKAAWESRFAASKLSGELPIFIYADLVHGFQFSCCEFTHVKRKMEEAKAAGQSFDLKTGLPLDATPDH
ncbi:hypothetical protein MARCHEWKA_00630 [Brevundimonas phage vB_BpoS-Marchewka]|uniref:Uncharacterized protein n=1 Tax=Brevundimonas phage vB_BpoS-Marchewka TaxID=2948604 RepID=A0A9E7N5J4_9CAUD|nr:hypothetical protein MARCHEWKA_00630 [Brevundimonas phage vB_BpoS-Marchewka]